MEGESLMLASRGSGTRNRRSHNESSLSPSTSMDSMNGASPAARLKGDPFTTQTLGVTPTPMIASATFVYQHVIQCTTNKYRAALVL
ncbi:hypothetical protein HYQ44_000268 [Verticillium longisporum]|nr:hypothetical protein HYQ44_000268 [Verticillium longisporum]